jgi:putative FmdB family regulatory protein
MPTYVYGCDSCGHRFEKFQKFTDAPLTDCPECGAHIRKIIQPAGIVFKGSGWYYTDSRSGNGSRASSTDGEKSAEPSKPGIDASKSSDGDGTKSTEKPAAKAESAASA